MVLFSLVYECKNIEDFANNNSKPYKQVGLHSLFSIKSWVNLLSMKNECVDINSNIL